MRLLRALFALSVLLSGPPARADEGMWTFDNFPSQTVERKYGFAPSQKWLDRVRGGVVRLGNGCSGSFVSRQGLVMTNHHCTYRCVQQLSSAEQNLIETGFLADGTAAEQRCPGLEITRLEEIRDVTGQVERATAGKSGEAYVTAKNAAIAEIENACGSDENIRCDVVPLYGGGLHHLYRYRRYQDVRLVFSPSVKASFFGGDPDNFNFPRYCFDVSFLRAYEDGKPVKTRGALSWAEKGVDAGDLVFVAGHPGSTNRLRTVAELEYLRDWGLPQALFRLSEERGLLSEFGRASPERARIAGARLFGVENALKALKGRRQALADDVFFGQLRAAELEFRRKVEDDPRVAQAFADVEGAMDTQRTMRFDLFYKEQHRNYGSRLFGLALDLLRWKEESAKPNAERLPEYAEAKKPSLQANITSPAPIYPELEKVLLGHYFTRLRAELGPDDPFVQAVLNKASPEVRAAELVDGTALADPERRAALFADPSRVSTDDPMVALAKVVSDAGRQVRTRYERDVESVVDRAKEVLAKARFDAFGTDVYPDATFSLRLSYGTVRGFEHRGQTVEPFTRAAGLYERATGAEPFELSAQWKKARDRLELDTPMNFVSDNDIIGGNSGSPILDADGRVVGLIFDGNIYSLGGDFGFDPRVNRAVSVDARIIRHGLKTVYGADRLLRELR